jgi:hypothetical protein
MDIIRNHVVFILSHTPTIDNINRRSCPTAGSVTAGSGWPVFRPILARDGLVKIEPDVGRSRQSSDGPLLRLCLVGAGVQYEKDLLVLV